MHGHAYILYLPLSVFSDFSLYLPMYAMHLNAYLCMFMQSYIAERGQEIVILHGHA